MKNYLKKSISLIVSVVLLFTTLAVPILAATASQSIIDSRQLKQAYLSAMADLEAAKSDYDSLVAQLKQNAAFYEDFESETQKIGYRNGGNSTKLTTEIASDNGDKYGKVTVNEGHAQSGYYGILDTVPVAVDNSNYYMVVFDYKVTGNVNNNIRFYRTSASSSSGVGESYLNSTDGWSTFEYKTPKYSIQTTVFYLQITGATPVGTEICIDNFMVLTPSDYESLNTAKTDYEKAVVACETAKAAYEASLSAEELAYIRAKEAMYEAESMLEQAKVQLKQNAAFYEDFESETQKIGYRNGGNSTKLTTEVASDNGNKYGKVTVNEGHAQSGYYGVLDATPVSVTDTDYYKVIFDYKITGTVNNNIRFYRTKAASADGVGDTYLNDVGEWKTFEYTTPKYTIDTTVFYLQITGATPVGTELYIDNFMVVTLTDYEKLEQAKTDYEKAVAACEAAKATYEASLSAEELAYIRAEEAMYEAESKLELAQADLKANAAFFEDYESDTNKMGHRTRGNDTFSEEIISDDDNNYAKVSVNDGAAASSLYGVDMGNGATDHSKFAVEASTDYFIAFKYKVANYGTGNVKLYRAITDISNNTGANMSYAFVESNDWTQATAKITTAATHSEYFFYFQILRNTGAELCLDDVMVVKVTDYEKLEQAKTDYQKAVADYETAKKVYEESLVPVSPEEAAYKAAKADYEGTKNSLYITAPFYEDYEKDTNKMGHVHHNNDNFTETIVAEGENHYASVIYSPESISAKYGVDLDNGQSNNTSFAVEKNTDYILSFRYKLDDYEATGYRRVYINDTFKYELNKNGIEGYANDTFVEFNSGDKDKVHFYIMVTGDHTTIDVDNFIVLKKSDYDLIAEKRRVYEEAKKVYEASINTEAALDPEQKHLSFEHTEGELTDYYDIGSLINAQVIADPQVSENHIAQLTASGSTDATFDGGNTFTKTFTDLEIGKLYVVKFDMAFKESGSADGFVFGGELRYSTIDSVYAPSGTVAELSGGKILQISADNSNWYTYMLLFNATESTAVFGLAPELIEETEIYLDNIKIEQASDSLVADTGKIRNPSFELDSPFPYTTANNLQVELDTENVSDGEQSLKCIGGGRIKQEIVVEPNSYYEWSFDLKFDETTSINTGTVLVQPGVPSLQSNTLVGGYSSSERNASSGYGYIACGDHEFNRYTVKFYTKNTTKITLTIIFRDNNKISYLDNMTLSKVGSAEFAEYEGNTVFDIDFDDGYSTAYTSKNGGSNHFSTVSNGNSTQDKCLEIDAAAIGNGTAINFKDKYHISRTSNLTLEKYQTYRFTFYAKTNSTVSNNFTIRHVFSQTSSQYTNTMFTLGTNWQKYEVYLSTTDDNIINFISFMITEPEENQKIYIDDIVFEKVDPQITSVNSANTWIDAISNRIHNGNFEKELTDANWGSDTDFERIVDKENALGGSAYVKFDGEVNYKKSVRVKGGRFFTFAFSYKTTTDQGDFKIGLMVDGKVMSYDIKPSIDSMYEIENTEGRWVRASYDFITPSAGYVELVIIGTADNVIVDEFCLFETILGLPNDVNDYTVYEENIPLLPLINYVDSLPETEKPEDSQQSSSETNVDNNSTVEEDDDKVSTSAPADDNEDTDDDDDNTKRKKVVQKRRRKKNSNNLMWLAWFIPTVVAVVVASGIVVFIIIKKKKGTDK